MLDEDVIPEMISALEDAEKLINKVASLLKRISAAESLDKELSQPKSAIRRAKVLHPELGPRQTQIIQLLETSGSDGAPTGVIAKAIGYPQPDVYLTLRGLVARGFVEKDESTSPQRYRLTKSLTS